MSEMEKPLHGDAPRGADDEETIRALVRAAGPRPGLPAGDLEAVAAAGREEWRRRHARRRAHTAVRVLAIAAALCVFAAALALLLPRRGAPGPAAAAVERFEGDVTVGPGGEERTALSATAVGRVLPAGSAIRTGRDGLIALRMTGGASVRLRSGSRADLVSAALVHLSSGAVYVDTGTRRGDAADIAVRTPFGLFEAVGTRFEVRAGAEGADVRLRVREGTVALRRDEGPVLVRAGQTLSVRRDGTIQPGTTALSGPDWEWVGRAAPTPVLEGRTAREVLDWVSRETGWRIETRGEEVARIVDSTVLHGSIDHLTPYDVPAVILPSCGLAHHLENGVLVVEAATRRAPLAVPGKR